MRVGAVYTERMSFGDVIMTRDDWAPHARQSGDTVLFVELADGVSDRRRQGGGRAGDRRGSTRRTRRPATSTSAPSSGQIDQMLFVVYGLLGIAVLIALMGIGNTLSLSIHERTRELGLLRAVGQTRSQLRSALRWESVIVAVFGTIGGIALGTFLGWGLMRALPLEEGFGSFALPVTPLAVDPRPGRPRRRRRRRAPGPAGRPPRHPPAPSRSDSDADDRQRGVDEPPTDIGTLRNVSATMFNPLRPGATRCGCCARWATT